MNFILDYETALNAGTIKVGGKGFNLSKLHHFGFLVPKGVVLSDDAYKLFVEENSLFDDISNIEKTITLENIMCDQSVKLLNDLHQKVLNATLPNKILSELENIEFLSHSLAVRSSATNEDSQEHSFAGIFESYLNVNGIDNLSNAIIKCYASLWTLQALSYQIGKQTSNSAMAVVIMKMATATASGVSFSCNPTNGSEESIIINANFGYGKSIVDGKIEPDSYSYNIENYTINQKQIGSKSGKTVLLEEGTSFKTEDKNGQQVLTDEQIQTLALLSKTVFETFDVHQDIEWVYDGKDFILVQARAITNVKQLYPKEIANQPKIFSNANVKDAVPFVQCKLNDSFFQLSINRLMGDSFRVIDYPIDDGYQFIKLINGRAYFNTSLIQWLWYDTLGLDPKETNLNLGGHQKVIEVGKKQKKFKYLVNGIKYMKVLKRYVKQSDTIFKDIKIFCDDINKKELSKLSNQALKELIFTLNQKKSAYGTPFIILASAVAPMSIMIKILERYFPDNGHSMANALLSGQSTITTAEHGYHLIALAKIVDDKELFKKGFDTFLKTFGHRCIYEADLRNKRWNEDPSYLLGLIKEYAIHDSFDNIHKKQKNDSEKTWQKIDNKVPFFLRIYIKKLLKKSSEGVAIKEMAKSTYIRFLESARKLFLECGERVGLDSFHCTQTELIMILDDKVRCDGVKKLIVKRKELFDKQEEIEAADIIVDEKATFVPPILQADGKSYKGIAVASGKVQAKVKKITHPDQYSKLKKGEILVAPSTDPAWTPMFLKASGIVLQTGGYLSHGSIVAREYGIPAVVNISGVMSLLEDGQEILVDGDMGKIVIIIRGKNF